MPQGASSVTPQPVKRAVNLTSGAFDFAFATPSPLSLAGKATNKPREHRPIGALGAVGAEWQTPSKTSAQVQVKQEKGTPIRELRPGGGEGVAGPSRLGAFSLGVDVKVKEEGDTFGRPAKTPRKLTKLTTPWTFVSAPDRSKTKEGEGAGEKRRRLGELGVLVPSPKVKEEHKEDLRRRVGLQTVGDGVRLDDIVVDEVDEKEGVGEKEVGWGISPRKGRIKWTGKGEPPLALRLNALITTQSSSLTLFYTSLAHTLHPASRSTPSRRRPDTKGDVKPDPLTTPTSITPLEHIRSAPIRLLLIRPLPAREHAACLWLAAVRTWPKAPVRLHIDDPDENDADTVPDEIIVNFATAAKGAAGLGGDIKVITGRWWEWYQRAVSLGIPGDEALRHEEQWDVGIWSEWSVLHMPGLPGGGGLGSEVGDQEGEVGTRDRKVLFASRYLVAGRR